MMTERIRCQSSELYWRKLIIHSLRTITHTNKHTYRHSHTLINTNKHTYRHSHTLINTNKHTYRHSHTLMNTNTHTLIKTCLNTYIYTSTHTSIHAYPCMDGYFTLERRILFHQSLTSLLLFLLSLARLSFLHFPSYPWSISDMILIPSYMTFFLFLRLNYLFSIPCFLEYSVLWRCISPRSFESEGLLSTISRLWRQKRFWESSSRCEESSRIDGCGR